MYAIDNLICRKVQHIFYGIHDTKTGVDITVQILYMPTFFSADDECLAFKEILKCESLEVDLSSVVVRPVTDIEESLIFELALLNADKSSDLFGPKKTSPTGIQYRVLQP